MKRHSSLAPLSRQHHGGLILAQLLKLNAATYKGMPTNTDGKKLYAIRFFNSDLWPHFEDEENVFATLIGINPLLDNEMKEITAEHVFLRTLFEQLAGLENPAAHLDLIGNTLEKHIRREERVLFPLMEKILDETRMNEIAILLNH